MTEESSDESSVYQEFATPSNSFKEDELYEADGEHETEPDSEELDWDNLEEVPSYIEAEPTLVSTPRLTQPHPRHPGLPLIFCDNPDPADPYSVWPVRRLSSDINNQLIINLVPRPENLRIIEDSLEDEVFLPSDHEDIITEVVPNMPPKVTDEQLVSKFQDEYRDWQLTIRDAKQEEEVPDPVYEEICQSYKSMRDTMKVLTRSAKDDFETKFPAIKTDMSAIRRDLIWVDNQRKKSKKEEEDNDDDASLADKKDDEVDEEIAKISVWFDLAEEKLKSMHSDLKARLIKADGTPVDLNDMLTLNIKSEKASLDKMNERSESAQLQVTQASLKYTSDVKKQAALQKLKGVMKKTSEEMKPVTSV